MVINLYVRVPLSYMLVTSHLFYSYGEDVLLALTATIRPSALLSDGYITRERGFRQIAPAAVAVKRPDGSGVHISSGSGLGGCFFSWLRGYRSGSAEHALLYTERNRHLCTRPLFRIFYMACHSP